MQNFIVLGIVPGTNFQTTFTFWMAIAVALFALYNIPRLIRVVQRLRRAFAAYRIAHTINQFDLIAL